MGGTEKAKGVSAKGRGTDVAVGAIKVCRTALPLVCMLTLVVRRGVGGVCICVRELWVYWYDPRCCSVV